MGIDQDTPSKSNLSVKLLAEVFAEIDPHVQIESFEEAQGSRRGDNYTAALFRIHVKGFVLPDGNTAKRSKWDCSLICKRLPDSQARRDAYRSEALFRNEVNVSNFWKSAQKYPHNRIKSIVCILPTQLRKVKL